MCYLPSCQAWASDHCPWPERSRQAPSSTDWPLVRLSHHLSISSLPGRVPRVLHTILEVKREGRDGSWGPGEGCGLSPAETSPGTPLACPVAWPEEMAEGARPCTLQHSYVTRVILVTCP